MKLVFFTILTLFCVSNTLGNIPGWFVKLEKLQKFPSTQKDVELFFNSPPVTYSSESDSSDKSWGKLIRYKIPKGELEILYSTGRCSNENTDGYDLEDGVILSYDFDLKHDFQFKNLKLNLRKFSIHKADDTEHQYFYNSQKGVRYTVLGNKLQTINFSLPDRFYRECKDVFSKRRKS